MKFILLFASFLFISASSFALELKPADKVDIASGSALNAKLWYPGGIGGHRLAVGNPNKFRRDDKVVFRFPLTGIKKNVARAVLCYKQDADKRNAQIEELIVEHFSEDTKQLTHAALKEKKVTQVGKYQVFPGKAVETILDVTAYVNEDLRRGYTGSTFRISSLIAEKSAPKNNLVNCVNINKSSVTLEILDDASLSRIGVILSPEGKTYQGIEVDPVASELACYAANELQEHLYKITGYRLPIYAPGTAPATPVIAIGRNAVKKRLNTDVSSSLRPEGFKIITTPDVLAIVGNDHEGESLLLDKYLSSGLNFFCFAARIAADKSIGLYLFGDAGSLYGVYHFLENYAGVRWYKPGPDGCVIQENKKLQIPQISFTDAPRINYRYPRGGFLTEEKQWIRRIRGGGSVPVPINHSFRYMLKYQKTHPQIFAIDKEGKRDFKKGCTISGHGHLCLTNPETVETFANDIIDFFRKNPDLKMFPVMPGDGLFSICNCPNCQKEQTPEISEGRYSRHVWGFVNKVAKKVAEVFPDKRIGCCAYEEYLTPPEDVKFEPNVAVMICYHRYRMQNPVFAKKIHKIIDAWKAKAKIIYTWNYYLSYRFVYKGLLPGSPRLFAEDYRRLFATGVWNGEFIEIGMNLPDIAIRHLLIYISGRLMWNPDTDIDALLDEYYKLFYGPAQKEMRTFYETAFQSFEQKRENVRKDYPPAPEHIYSQDVLKIMENAIAGAIKATPANSVYRRRVVAVNKEFSAATQKLKSFVRKGKPNITAVKLTSTDMIAKTVPVSFAGRNGEIPEHRTWVAAGYDANKLYLRFYCYEEQMKKLKASYKGSRDNEKIWADDTIEVFISPELAEPAHAYQVVANPNGAVYDGELIPGTPITGKWNLKNLKVKVTRQAERWILDMSIPLSELGVTPEPGKKLIVNFYRNRATGSKGFQSSCFAPVFTANNFEPNRFGTLIFEK